MTNRRLRIAAASAAAIVILLVALIMLAVRNAEQKGTPADAAERPNVQEQPADELEQRAKRPLDGPAYTIRIQADDRSRQVSETLYGIFYEDINYAGDGGLYAEMVQNRSFEFGNPLYSWRHVTEDGAAGRVTTAGEAPLSENNPRYLVIQAERGGLGVSNSGYGGMYVEAGKAYDLTLYGRVDQGGEQLLAVSLRERDDTEIGACEISIVSGEWQQYGCTITAEATSEQAKLTVLAVNPGTVSLDMISLFPQHTWKGRKNGLREDLAQMLADLNPKFLRFPGGCIVEGGSIENHYRWKNTIGDAAERKVQPNQWAPNYYQSFGLGFHEYFLLAEDLGAEPLPVIYAGITSCHGQPPMVPLSEMQEYIDHALDLIEYANGDPETSEWAAKRAENGHPEPFNLKYLAIGNELWGTNYYTRYKMIYDAIKAEYPDIQLIFSAGAFPNDMAYHEAYAWLARNGNPADLVDEHMYQAPEWFLSQADRYDNFDRHGPKVFVGEYAAHGVGRRNNMEAALAEAAFMTGLERNSDIVAMAAYAPLFGRHGYTQWQPNLIWFDQSRVYGTPSYYVQHMFSNHVGHYVLPTEITAERPVPSPSAVRGSILLGSWMTQVEYDDVMVTDAEGEVLFSADFSEDNSLEVWSPASGNWRAEDGVLKQSSLDADVRLYLQQGQDWSDYTLSLRARKTGGHEGMLIGFAVQDPDHFYWWNIGGWNNTVTAVEKATGGVKTIVSHSVSQGVITGQWYDIRVEIRGGMVRCYLNDALIHEWEESTGGPLFSVSTYDEDASELILKVVNVSAEDLPSAVEIEGKGKIAAAGRAIVLQADPAAENTLEQPENVVPQEIAVSGLGSRFEYVFPAHSVTVLRIQISY